MVKEAREASGKELGPMGSHETERPRFTPMIEASSNEATMIQGLASG